MTGLLGSWEGRKTVRSREKKHGTIGYEGCKHGTVDKSSCEVQMSKKSFLTYSQTSLREELFSTHKRLLSHFHDQTSRFTSRVLCVL